MSNVRQHLPGLLVALLACSGPASQIVAVDAARAAPDSAVDVPALDDAAVANDVAAEAAKPVDADPGYPEGPYGARVGSVVPNFTFQGYWAPTQTTGLSSDVDVGAVTFDMLRRTGARYGFLQLAGYW